MYIHIGPGNVRGGEHTMMITLRGNDDDFIGLVAPVGVDVHDPDATACASELVVLDAAKAREG